MKIFRAYNFPMKKKMGRPPKGQRTQSARIYLRADESEKAEFEQAAASAGLTLSDWIRDRLKAAAKKENRRAD